MSGQPPLQKVPSPAVQLAEEPGRRWYRDPNNAGGLRPLKENDLRDNAQAMPVETPPKWMKSRFDSSLFVTTRKFMETLKNAPEGVIHLKKVASQLGVPKRRIYDITSVLHGIRVVEKISKNQIRWVGPDISDFQPSPPYKKLREELYDLSAMEQSLDELIKDCSQQLYDLTDDKDNEGLAYVTYQDVQSIQAFREQMSIAVKTPEETTLEIPPPTEDSITLCIRSTKGPIDVYLFERKKDHSSNNVSEDVTTSSPKGEHPEQPDEKQKPSGGK